MFINTRAVETDDQPPFFFFLWDRQSYIYLFIYFLMTNPFYYLPDISQKFECLDSSLIKSVPLICFEDTSESLETQQK